MKSAIFLPVFFLLTLTPALSSAMSPPTVYVSGDGTGDFNCDGENDQIEINQALEYVHNHSDYTTVYLKGPNVFWIDDTIIIYENTTLEGDSDSVVKLVDDAKWWTQYKPFIAQKGYSLALELGDPETTTGNITIRGFEIDGNRDNQSEPSGKSFYNAIRLQNCYNITINDMYIHHNLADAIQITYDEYILDIDSRFFNNRVHHNGHDSIYLRNVGNFEVYDNIFTDNRTDAGIRAQHCNHYKLYNNIIGNNPSNRYSGGAGIQIQMEGMEALDDVEIFGNYLYGHGFYHGIWLNQTSGAAELNTQRDVHIHHNVVSSYRDSAIGIEGFNNTLIENNVLESQNGDEDDSFGSGVRFVKGDAEGDVSGFVTIVRNNIIINTAGYGLDNAVPDVHSFVSDYNLVYGNALGDYNNASSTTDIHVAPELASTLADIYADILVPAWDAAIESGDYSGDLGAHEAWNEYHLKSSFGRWNGEEWVNDSLTSPCVDAGDPAGDFSNEPANNGDRLNIGAFGNTTEASKSPEAGSLPAQAANPNPADGALDVDLETILSWTARADTDRHDIYFGTSSSPPFVQTQTEAIFDPGLLENDTTYFWRIDEINEYGKTIGVEWSFTTSGGGASCSAMGASSNPDSGGSRTMSYLIMALFPLGLWQVRRIRSA